MPLNSDMSNELRTMVREVLRDVMATRTQATGDDIEAVRIANDHDLAVFVARILEPATLERVRAGTLRFTLNTSTLPSAAACGVTLTGVITEQKLDKMAGPATLLLGPDAVLTPLARDKARKLGLKIERRR